MVTELSMGFALSKQSTRESCVYSFEMIEITRHLYELSTRGVEHKEKFEQKNGFRIFETATLCILCGIHLNKAPMQEKRSLFVNSN